MSNLSFFVEFMVKITPNSSVNLIVGWESDSLKIRLRASPEKGNANEALIELLARALKIPKSQIRIVSGFKARIKRIRIDGIEKSTFKNTFLRKRERQ